MGWVGTSFFKKYFFEFQQGQMFRAACGFFWQPFFYIDI
jgi:hypothetical protein